MKYFTIILILFPITIFAQIQLIQTINDGALENVSQVVISPDDRFVYAVGGGGFTKGFAGYERDTVTGSLTQIMAIDSIDGTTLEISNSGKYLFVQNYNNIDTYERNLQNGQITLVSSILHIHNNHSSDMELPSNDAILAVTNDGYHEIHLYSLDTATGILSNPQVFDYWNTNPNTTIGASGISFTTDDQYFAVAAINGNVVTIFKKNASGQYQIHQIIQNNGNYNWDEVYNVIFSSNSNFLYATSTDGITTFEFSNALQKWGFKNHVSNVITTNNSWDRITNIKLSKNEQSLFVLSSVSELIHYDRNPTTGLLSNPTVIKDNINGVNGLNAPNDITVSHDGKNLYIVSLLEDALSVFSFDAITKNINFMELHSGDSMNVDGLYAVHNIVRSPDGKYFYATGTFRDAAIAVFERDTTNGTLNFIQEYDFADNHNHWFGSIGYISITSDGEFLFFLNQYTLYRFKRNPTTGLITYIGENPGVDWSFKIAPNDKYLINFVENYNAGRIYEISSDSLADLTLKSELNATQDTIGGLLNIRAFTISDDSRFIYGSTSVSMTQPYHRRTFMEVFEVDTASLELKHIQTLNTDNFPPQGWGQDMVIGRNGRTLYVADGGLAVYHRDTATGKLICVHRYDNNQNGISGLSYTNAIDISPNDGKIFITGRDTIVVFQANQLNDSLGFVTFYALPPNPNSNYFISSSAISCTPDGHYFYITRVDSSAIFAFENQSYLDTIPLGLQAPLCINVVSFDEEIPTENKIKVFPNPTSNVINIELIQDKPQDVRITIVNTLGQVVKNQKVKLLSGEQNLTFDISDLPKGIYFLNINGESVKILKL